MATKAAKAEVTEVVTQGNTSVASYAGYEGMESSGFENQDNRDYALPFLTILQGLSPQLEENKSLRQGLLFNSVTGEAFDGDEGVRFIPCATKHSFIEYKPRKQGGGFVAEHKLDSEVVKTCLEKQDFGKYTVGENELVETYQVFGIIDGEDGPCHAAISFKSMAIKKFKGWMTQARTIQIQLESGKRINAPLFSHAYRLRTIAEKNAKGSFYNWNIKFDGENAAACRLAPDSELVQMAVALNKVVQEDKVKVDHDSVSRSESNSTEAETEY